LIYFDHSFLFVVCVVLIWLNFWLNEIENRHKFILLNWLIDCLFVCFWFCVCLGFWNVTNSWKKWRRKSEYNLPLSLSLFLSFLTFEMNEIIMCIKIKINQL
jgi:hypothetical protein